jgi:hypothetical protein
MVKRPLLFIFAVLPALLGWCAASGSERPTDLEPFRPQWQIGRQWTVETESRQAQWAAEPGRTASARWHFSVESIDQLQEQPCWRIVARIVQGDRRLEEPRTTIWVDQTEGSIRQIETQVPTAQGYRAITESYISGPRSSPVIGFSSMLPIALPRFPIQGEKGGDTFEYELVSGAAGVKQIPQFQQIGFVTSVRQELLTPSEAGLKSMFGDAKKKDLENQSLLEVKLSTPRQQVRQIWREGTPWPLYADNGLTKMWLVETAPDHSPRAIEQDSEGREAASTRDAQRRGVTPETAVAEEAMDDRPGVETRPLGDSPSLAGTGGVEKATARITPWSGYWWPIREGRLLVPLTKYDLLTQRRAAEWERVHFPPGPEVPAWHGYCHAWAAASVLEAEPSPTGTTPVATLQVPLDTGDRKGLLTACHTEDLANTWGERTETGDQNVDGRDFPPDLLWQLLRLHLGDAGVPLILDIEPGAEVWNYPVYHYEVHYQPLDEQGRHQAEMTLLMADNGVSTTYQGTKIRKQTYQFTVDIHDGNLIMGTGRWTGLSEQDHPDFAWYPYQARATNPEICHDQVRQLVAAGPVPPSSSPVDSATESPEGEEPDVPPSGPEEVPIRPEPLVVTPAELAALIADQTSSFSFDATVDRFDGASYMPGEHFFLRVTSGRPGYLYLLQVDRSGVPTLLYPTAGEDNRIPRGESVEIRPAGVAKGFPVVGPAGTLRLKSIVTSRPLAFSGSLESRQLGDAHQPRQGAGLPVPFRWYPTQQNQISQLLRTPRFDAAKPMLPPREVLGPFAQDLTVIYIDRPQRPDKN